MQLKNYQQQALEQLDRWLDALKKAKQLLGETGAYPLVAWDTLKQKNTLADYISRTADSGAPIPHVCLKVPTGGGKTLLGVAALERIKQDTGFVLWIVPTKAIYEQTIQAFRTREHPYRQMLERISGGKVKLLEKTDRFTRQDVESHLCVMMLMLPSANREKGKEFLKIFRDSSGYDSFFPSEDDTGANNELFESHPDLEKNAASICVKQSLINVLKLIRPTVILDEAHKAYGTNADANEEFVKSVNRLNPRLVLELSATPKLGISNILVNIPGTDLQAEEMIKLPIEIHTFNNSDWKHTLAETQDKLKQLEKETIKLRKKEGRYVRPIAVVRVQFTGKNQRERGRVHAEDAREYLIRRLAVPEAHIRIQSSEQKGLAGENLLDEASSVRWIITKDALKEGWDCSFAYVLALLDNTTAQTAITQMIGRVMRQPHARTIDHSDALNRCYIYCFNREVGETVEWVKSGLENEGLTGLGDFVTGGADGANTISRTVNRRAPYRKLNIFLPKVLHKSGRKWRLLDYDRDILAALDWAKMNAGSAMDLDDSETRMEITAAVDIQGESVVSKTEIDTDEKLSLDYFVRRLADVVPNPWQAARIAEAFIAKHRKKYDEQKLLENRIFLSETLQRRVKEKIDTTAEQVFRSKVHRNEIRFDLVTDENLNYEFYRTLEVSVAEDDVPLSQHGEPVQKSLFEDAFSSKFNGLERDFALYLEDSNAIHWWHRIAARQSYSLQGWRRHRIYPDFVACRQDGGKLFILETKGNHLAGSEDTEYKKRLLSTLEHTYENAIDRGKAGFTGTGTVEEPELVFRMMFENTWRENMNTLLTPPQ